MSRHRHTVNVRADGLQAVLGPLARDRRVLSAVLVDVDSGMVLDACSQRWGRAELEELGAGHAELVRAAGGGVGDADRCCELVLSRGDGWHHVVRTVPDPHGDRLALGVVVAGRWWAVWRARRRLRTVSAPALTAGPTVSRRPGAGGWSPPVAASPRSVVRAPARSAPARSSGVGGWAAVRPGGAVSGDPALSALGPAVPRVGARAAAALSAVGRDERRPAAPVLRAVPRPAAPPRMPSAMFPRADRPAAPLSALAPGPRRDRPPADA
ncbi:hypothetical protein ACVGOW_15665 [Pseudonocardia saturnea]